jgi:MFS family permease
LVALALRAPVPIVAAAGLFAGLGIGCFGPLWDSTMQREIPPELLSRVSSYDWLGSVATLPLGYIVAGPIANAIGVRTSLIGGATILLLSIVAVLATPSVRNLVPSSTSAPVFDGPNPATIGISE